MKNTTKKGRKWMKVGNKWYPVKGEVTPKEVKL